MLTLLDFTNIPKLRTILDTIPAALFIKNAKSQIILINRACEERWGATLDQVYMTDGSSVFPSEQVQSFIEKDQEIFAAGCQQDFQEMFWSNSNQENRVGHTFKRPIYDESGEPSFIVAVTLDITDQARSEAAFLDVQQKMRGLMSQLTSSLAHEVNQPLTAVSNWILTARRNLLKMSDSPPQTILDQLDNAIEQAYFAAKVVSNLRNTLVRGDIETSPVSINETIEEVLSVALVGAHKSNVTIKFDFGKNLPDAIIDKVQIQQVLINLVRNAVQAMKKSETRHLVIATSASSYEFLKVRITDTGPGISPEVMAHLFKRFVSTKSKGMGLGLSICKTIVELHGGRLHAEPGPKGGTSFSFTVPTAKAAMSGSAGKDAAT